MKEAQNPKEHQSHERELHPLTVNEMPRYGANPEQASANLKKKRKRIQR
ncbi:hypothetical protein [Runella sp.]